MVVVVHIFKLSIERKRQTGLQVQGQPDLESFKTVRTIYIYLYKQPSYTRFYHIIHNSLQLKLINYIFWNFLFNILRPGLKILTEIMGHWGGIPVPSPTILPFSVLTSFNYSNHLESLFSSCPLVFIYVDSSPRWINVSV